MDLEGRVVQQDIYVDGLMVSWKAGERISTGVVSNSHRKAGIAASDDIVPDAQPVLGLRRHRDHGHPLGSAWRPLPRTPWAWRWTDAARGLSSPDDVVTRHGVAGHLPGEGDGARTRGRAGGWPLPGVVVFLLALAIAYRVFPTDRWPRGPPLVDYPS